MALRVDQIEGHSFVVDLLDADKVSVDLGVNCGAFAANVIKRYGVRVVGAEPVPQLYRQLKTGPNLVVEQVAVTSSTGETTLFVNNRRCASVRDELAEDDAQLIIVPAVTLAELIERHEILTIDLLKVDIEGAEIGVLLGVDPELAARIRQITVEFHSFLDPALADGVNAVNAHLKKLGFQRFDMSRNQTDVLYINAQHLPLSRLQTAYLLVRFRYIRGAIRLLRRIISRSHVVR